MNPLCENFPYSFNWLIMNNPNKNMPIPNTIPLITGNARPNPTKQAYHFIQQVTIPA